MFRPHGCDLFNLDQVDQSSRLAYLACMSRQVNLYEAKTHLSRLVEQAAKGETIVIAKGGRALAKLVPLNTERKQPRELGQLTRRSKNVDWEKWWRDWKAADKKIEAEFEASALKAVPSKRPTRRS